MTLAISIGKYGGFYVHNGYTKRLCLGWVAITIFPKEIDEIIFDALNHNPNQPTQ